MIITKGTQTREDFQPTTLYVVFHGEIILIDDGVSDYIVAAAPVIRSHIYQAGPWLGELRIERGAVLQLKGVNSGKCSAFDNPDRMLLIDNVPGSTEANWHFLIVLPRPYDILPGLVLNLQPGTFKNPEPPGVKYVAPPGSCDPTGVDAHPIFKYTVTDGKEPLICDVHDPDESPLFEPGEGRPNYLSLHISAEEDRMAPPVIAAGHAREAFTAVKEFLGIKTDFYPGGQVDPRSPVLIPGLDPTEYTMPLAARTKLLGQIGAQQRFGASPDLAGIFREEWTLAGGFESSGKRPFAWFPEGTCGATGARMVEGVNKAELLARIGK